MPRMLIPTAALAALLTAGVALPAAPGTQPFDSYTLGFDTPTDASLQSELDNIDATLRAKFDMTPEQAAVGVLDLKTLRLAMIHPDRIEYAASIPKVGILLAYFQLHPDAATKLDPTTRHELGLMAKASNNEMAAKFSREMGLKAIQQVINDYKLYDKDHGGGIWVGKHYGKGGERIGDPVGDNSHAATVRQLLRFWLMLEQGKLVSPAASKTMRDIFASPDIPHDNIKFVKALKDREGLEIIRKWGSWENWLHDSAVITAPNRQYILVGLTKHSKGDEYLEALAGAVDDLLAKESGGGS
jgi:beta-lactamase class A